MPRKIFLGLMVTVLVAFAAALPAVADDDEECVGVIGPVEIDGDLVVPEGATCDLEGTIVNGDVVVKRDASLFTDRADIGGRARGGDDDDDDDGDGRGDLRVEENGYADLLNTSVDGSTRLHSSLGLVTETSALDRGIGSRDAEFVDLFETSVDGDVELRGGPTQFFGERLDVDGDVDGEEIAYLDIYDSSVDGAVGVEEASEGGFLCGSSVEDRVRYEDSSTIIDLGGFEGCDANRLEDDVEIIDNTAEIAISGNVIEEDLVCRDNEPPPVGGGNFVEGDAEGQCEDLEAAEAPARRAPAHSRTPEAARERAEARSQARRGQ
jgi:hypothetical protein